LTARVRLAYAAAHVVMRDDYAAVDHTPERPGSPDEIAAYIDWEQTMALRARLDRLGFGIAEAMDTAQRFSLGWKSAERLIRECGRAGLEHGFIAGAGVDHLERVGSSGELIDGVVHQAELIAESGGQVILLPLVWLAARRADEDEYVRVYEGIIARVEGPLFVHWLGEQFLPELAGYFPGRSFERIMGLDPSKVRGAKISLLDPAREVRIRAELLARDQIVLTGDDFHFARLIRGGDPDDASAVAAPVERWTRIGADEVALGDFSHALLGVIDAVAAPAGRALQLLARGDVERAMELLEPCEALGRWIFRPPTQHYKTGLALLSWLNGQQSNCMLVNHEERSRDVTDFFRTMQLAVSAGVFDDDQLAAERLKSLVESTRPG